MTCWDEGLYDPRLPALPWYVDPCQDPPVVQPIATVPHWWTNPAIWVWAGIIIGVLAVEIWARFGKKHQSPSQWLRKQAATYRWLQVFGTALFSFLIWHFFYAERLFTHRSPSTNGPTSPAMPQPQ